MKKLTTILILIIISVNMSFGQDFTATPLIFDIKGIETAEDGMVAYGNKGMAMIYSKETGEWRHVKVSIGGNIVNMFLEDERITAFFEGGKVSVSYDDGRTWEESARISDSLVYVIKSPDSYYIRGINKIIKLGESFAEEKEVILPRIKFYYNGDFTFIYRKSIVLYDNGLIAMADSSLFLKYSLDLDIMDSLSFKKLGLCESCWGRGLLLASPENLYASSENYLYRIDDFNSADTILQFYDNYILFDSISPHISYLNISGNRMYSLNGFQKYSGKVRIGQFYNVYEITGPGDAKKLGEFDFSKIPPQEFLGFINYFAPFGDDLYIVADNKYIAKFNPAAIKTEVISDLRDFNVSSGLRPDIINGGDCLIYTKNNIFRASNNFNEIKKLKPKGAFIGGPISPPVFNIKEKYFDKEAQALYLGGNYYGTSGYILKTDDYGQSFDSIRIEKLTFANSTTALKRIGDIFYIGSSTYYKTPWTWIKTYDKGFNMLSILIDTTFQINRLHLTDTNNIIVKAYNITIGASDKLLYTSDRGNSWNLIKEYKEWVDTVWKSPDEYVLQSKKEFIRSGEVKIGGSEYWILISNKKDASALTVEALNLDTKGIETIFEKSITGGATEFYTGIEEYQDTLYIAINDTIFYTHDIYNKESWQYYKLPDSSRVYGIMKKAGGSFIAKYKNDDYPYSVYLLEPVDNKLSSGESEINNPVYFYSFPPYPLPATDYVNCHIFWDSKYSIENTDIAAYDLAGNRVASKSDFELIEESEWSGILRLNCGKLPQGVYFIQINHGGSKYSIKFIKTD